MTMINAGSVHPDDKIDVAGIVYFVGDCVTNALGQLEITLWSLGSHPGMLLTLHPMTPMKVIRN